MREVQGGWIFRVLHFNGASLFLVIIYYHVGRGLICGSWRLWKVWSRGIILFFLLIAEAFIGYVLPWGQMSVWGACVITSLLRVIPFVGDSVVVWVWGGLVVNRATLGCFFIIHYLLPFVILVVIGLHILFLHEIGRTSRGGRRDREFKVEFLPYFIFKDLVNLLLWRIFFILCFLAPFSLGDCENLKEANLIRSPIHIQPEWYYLAVYAILRAIPSKIGGVLSLVFSLVIVWILSFISFSSQRNNILAHRIILSWLGVIFLALTWLGRCPVESPFVVVGQVFTLLYFFCFFIVRRFWFCIW